MLRRLLVALALVGAAVAPARAQPDLPTPRAMSGTWQPDQDVATGTAQVRLTYGDLADVKPPAGVAVVLVGYAAAGGVTVARAKTDGRGVATFAGLDTTGAVAYYALAALPRQRAADRLVASALVLHPPAGARVILSSELRTDTAAPIDEHSPGAPGPRPAPPKGKVLVTIGGLAPTGVAIELFDAATGKVVAKGTASDKELMLAVALRTGQVLYAEGVWKGGRYRSAPFLAVADRGAATTILVYPRIIPTFQLVGEVDDVQLRVTGEYHLRNYSFLPYGENLPLTIPLPGSSITITRPIPPGGHAYDVQFDVPAVGRDIALKLDLPWGSFQSTFYIGHDGATLESPPTLSVSTLTRDGTTYFALSNITLQPNKSLELTLHPPVLTRAEAALAQACRPLAPDRHPQRGKVAPSFTLDRPDGKPLKLSSLRGKPVLLSFMASWDVLSPEERPRLVKLARSVPELRIVMLASDTEPAKVAAAIGTTSPFQVVLDPPAAGGNIGRVTTSWGIKLLPESVLLDRNGVVRFYFANARDWSTPEALACVKAVAAVR